MTFDGVQYIRGDDVLVWQNSEAGQKYTPEEFVGCNTVLTYDDLLRLTTETLLDYVDGKHRVRSEHHQAHCYGKGRQRISERPRLVVCTE